MADHQRIRNANGMGDAVDGATGSDDGFCVVVAIDAHDFIAGQSLLVNADGGRVVLRVVRWQQHRIVHEDAVGVGQIPPPLVRVATACALFGRTGDADDLKRRPPAGGEVGKYVFQVCIDLWPVGCAVGILCDEQPVLIEQLHVHVDVVDAIVRQYGHFDVMVYPVEIRHQLVDFLLGVVRKVCPPRGTTAVLLHNQLGCKGGSKSVGHPVSTGVHQVERRGGCTVNGDAHEVPQDVGDRIVQRSGPVVQPVHEHPVIVPVAVNRGSAVIPDPNRIVLGFYHRNVFQWNRSAASRAG